MLQEFRNFTEDELCIVIKSIECKNISISYEKAKQTLIEQIFSLLAKYGRIKEKNHAAIETKVVQKVAKKLKVLFDPGMSVTEIEDTIFAEIGKRILERLTPEENENLEKELKRVDEEMVKAGLKGLFATGFTIMALESMGFGAYILAVKLLSIASFLGISGGISAATVTSSLALLLNPIGWIVAPAAVATIIFGGKYLKAPDYLRLLPPIIYSCQKRIWMNQLAECRELLEKKRSRLEKMGRFKRNERKVLANKIKELENIIQTLENYRIQEFAPQSEKGEALAKIKRWLKDKLAKGG